MKIIYGQCASCEKVAEYSIEDMKRSGMVPCKNKLCRQKSVWRIYTDAEKDQMREGVKVE